MEDYISAGFDPDAFWFLTPRLYLAHMTGASVREKAKWDMLVSVAHLNAVLVRSEKIPELQTLLAGKARTSGAEVQATITVWKDTLPTRTWDEWRNQ